MQTSLPGISVVLPVYNGIAYLEKSVYSVLNQSFGNFELIIVDDCSSDGSFEWLSSINDVRVKLFRNDVNKGLFYNLNFLIQRSQSMLIKLWSQDDIMYPNCLASFFNFQIKHPEVGFSYSNRDYIDESGRVTISGIVDYTPAIVNSISHARIAFFTGSIAGNIANVAISSKALQKVGLFNEQMKISGDFDMWVRIAEFFPVGFINEPLVQLRNHQQQLSNQEHYYIYHVKEDIKVYRYLLSYCRPGLQKEGMRQMQNSKLLFYYTLMLKSFFKGKIGLGWQFAKTLAGFTNLFTLTLCYAKSKLWGTKNFMLQKHEVESSLH